MNIDTISIELPIVYTNTGVTDYGVFQFLKVVLILANSADPDEMQHYAAFYLGLHVLP